MQTRTVDSVNLSKMYEKAFSKIDEGATYEEMSEETGIPVELLCIQHIRVSRQDSKYEEMIGKYALQLISKYGCLAFFQKVTTLTEEVPFKFRAAVAHLVYNWLSS